MIFLVFYVNVEGLSNADARSYMHDAERVVDSMPPDVHMFVLPVKQRESGIECIYPKFIVSSTPELKEEFLNYEQAMKQLSEYIKVNLSKNSTKISE